MKQLDKINLRRYTLHEIDQMRQALSDIGGVRDDAEIEDRLRTHMLNGTDPEELIRAGSRASDEKILAVYERKITNYRMGLMHGGPLKWSKEEYLARMREMIINREILLARMGR